MRVNRYEFAAQRSHDAAVAANENSRPMAQYALIINGAAASAIIAFLSKEKVSPEVLSAAPWSLILYAVGVMTAAISMYFMTEALDYVSDKWQQRAFGGADFQIPCPLAEKCWCAVRLTIGLSILLFIVGSGIFAVGLLHSATAGVEPCVYTPG